MSEQTKQGWSRRTHAVPFVLAALFLCYAPALVLGIGASPCFLFAGAMFVAILAWLIARRSEYPLRVELIGLCIIFCVSAAACYLTAHPGTNRLFELAFGIAPPPGVTNVEGRVQWYDGQSVLIHFNADEAAFNQLLASRKFKRDQDSPSLSASNTRDVQSVDAAFNLSAPADPNWRRSIPFQTGVLYKYENLNRQPSGWEATTVFRNELGDVWVLYAWT